VNYVGIRTWIAIASLGAFGAGCEEKAGGGREAPPLFTSAETAKAPVETALRFEDGTEASGVRFLHVPARTADRFMPEIMGSGVVLADFDRDGAPDLLLVNSGALRGTVRTPEARNRFYLNDGKSRFRDASDAWQVPSPGYGMGAAAGDFDNDGWLDLFLTGFGGSDVLLRNTGAGFEDVTARAGVRSDGRWSTSAGFFDMESDGDLDLYVVRYVDYRLENALKCWHNDVHVYCTPILYDAVPDRLWRNDGGGRFTDASGPAGIAGVARKGLALATGDVDADGDVDLYVANDTSRNLLWLNDGRGRFEDRAMQAGVALSEAGAEEAGMGADFSDVNGDGLVDITRTNFQSETTSIYRQSPGFVFREVSDAVGVGESARARLKFGVDFFDADNDGDEDLLVANGHIEDNVGSYTSSVTFAQPNTLYENLGDGRFRDVTTGAGPALQDVQVSRGLATGDLDGDGDLDFVVANNGGTAQVCMNTSAGLGGFVGLWLEGRRANRSALGARVEARAGERTIVREVRGASSYLSMCDLRVHLGIGSSTAVDQITITWPGGATQVLQAVAAGAYYRILEGQPPQRFVPGDRRIDPS